LITAIGLKVPTANVILNTPLDYILSIFALALIPAVFEELVFRGLILNDLDECNTILSCVAVGVIFALFHGSLVQFFYQFIYGVALCFLTLKSKSVLPAIITHFINNFAVLTFTFFNVYIDFFSPLIIAIGLTLICIFVASLIFFERFDKTINNNKLHKL